MANNLTREDKVMERKVGRHVYMGWREQDVAKIHRWITENRHNPVIFGNKEIETMFPDRGLGAVQAKFYEQMRELGVRPLYQRRKREKKAGPTYIPLDSVAQWCQENLVAKNSRVDELVQRNNKLMLENAALKQTLNDIREYIK